MSCCNLHFAVKKPQYACEEILLFHIESSSIEFVSDEESESSASSTHSNFDLRNFPLMPPIQFYELIQKMENFEDFGFTSDENNTSQSSNDSQSSASHSFQPDFFKQFLKHKKHLFELLKRRNKGNELQKRKVNDKLKPGNHTYESTCLDAFEDGHYLQAFSFLCSKNEDLKAVFSSEENDKANLLHHAAKHGWNDIISILIKKHGFDPMSTDAVGQTAVHYAAKSGQFKVFKVLVEEHHCDPMHKSSKSESPLYFATKAGCIEIVKYYMKSKLGCDGNTTYNYKPLGILAAEHGHFKLLIYLIEECKFCITYSHGNDTALDYAAQSGHLLMVKYLVSVHHFEPNKNKFGRKNPLHHASEKGHFDVVKYLIVECKCDVHCVAEGLTPLQYAALNGNFKIVKYFIKEHKCIAKSALRYAAEHGNIDIVKYLADDERCENDSEYSSSLDWAIEGKHADVVKYLVNRWGKDTDLSSRLLNATCRHSFPQVEFLILECHVDPTTVYENGRTLLHYAAENIFSLNGLMVVQCLLATGRLDPLKKDKKGDTPLAIAGRSRNKRATVPIFHTFAKTKAMYPIESYVNILIVGNSGAGKSTLSKVIERTATGYNISRYLGANEVKLCTAGIIPTKLEHKKLRNVIIHDFAGHSEYYLSHTAVIENLLQGLGAVIVIVLDVSLSDFLTQFKQWLMVVRNETQKAKEDCRVIVVASHIDCLSDENKKKTVELMKLEMSTEGDDLEIEYLDCRRLGGDRLDSFLTKLQSACNDIREKDQRCLTLYCHMMYNLLQESEKEIFTLDDIAIEIGKKSDRLFLPVNHGKEILNILSSLHSTGLIYYLNCEKEDGKVWETDSEYVYTPFNCRIWVIKNKEVLLENVNGILFSPKTFKEHPNINKNGIIPVFSLIKYFPKHDPIMLVSFLENIGLCHIVSPLFLLQTNLIKEKLHVSDKDSVCLFFPSLVETTRPDIEDEFCFGWYLECTKRDTFFSQRVFNALLLHLSIKHSVEEAAVAAYNVYHCDFWKNGMRWCDENGITIVTELVDESQCILVLMACDKRSTKLMIPLRRNLITVIMATCRKFCPGLEVEAYIIDPNCLKPYPSRPRERTVYCVENIKKLKGNRKYKFVNPSRSPSARKGKCVCDVLPDEPDYENLSIFGEYVKV